MMLLTAFASTMAAAAIAPHVETIEHRGSAYEVHYVSHVETRSRTIGISPPTRQSTKRCMVTMTVSVERRVHPAGGGTPIASRLPARETFRDSTAGACRKNGEHIAAMTDRKAGAIAAHVSRTVSADRPALLAEIDAARALAMN